jgi:hypothetical protein
MATGTISVGISFHSRGTSARITWLNTRIATLQITSIIGALMLSRVLDSA